MRRILALEGGGIKGAVSAVGLGVLQAELGGDLADHFDVVAGSSTGAIEAGAIGLRIPPLEIEQVYASRGLQIFPRPHRRWFLPITIQWVPTNGLLQYWIRGTAARCFCILKE